MRNKKNQTLKKYTLWKVSSLLLFQFFTFDLSAQTSEYEVKAVFLWTISQYIDWPPESNLQDKEQPFIIGVIGENPFDEILNEIYIDQKRTIKEKNVEIHYLTSLDKIKNCHLLFIPGTEKDRLNNIISITNETPVLTVSDTPGFAQKGIHINFFIAQNKIRFELNEKAVQNAGLKINYRLQKIAKIVETVRGGK